MSVSSVGFSQANFPLTELYEHMTEPVWPCRTAASKPRSSISCSVRSSTLTLIVCRWFSWLFSA